MLTNDRNAHKIYLKSMTCAYDNFIGVWSHLYASQRFHQNSYVELAYMYKPSL